MQQLRELKGLGAARLAALEQAGIFSLSDLLLTLPLRYQDTTTITPLAQAVPGGEICAQRLSQGRAPPFPLSRAHQRDPAPVR